MTETTSPRTRWATAVGTLRQPATAVFVIALVAGLALRVAYVFSAAHHMDSDHSVVYLMARHVAHGEFPAFFWGQSYGGTLLQWVAGTVMLVTGPSIEVLGIVSALFWAVAAVLLRQIVLIAAGPVAGNVAGILFWFPGVVILGTSLADPGFYGPSLAIGLGAIWISVRTTGPRPIWSWAVLGTLGGLALWTSPMSIAFAIPAIIVAMVEDRRRRRWLIGLGFGIIAASAWIYETVVSRLSSVKPLGGASFHPESLASIFTAMFPAAFPGGDYELIAFVIALGTVAAIVGIVCYGIRTRNRAVFVLAVATVLVVGVLVAGTGTRLAADSVRYSGFLVPGMALAIALLVVRIRRQTLSRAIAVGLAVLAIAVTTGLAAQRGAFRFDTSARFDPAFSEIGAYLEDNDITAGYGSYWVAYAISAATEERVTIAAFTPARYEPYEEAARGDAPMALVVYAGFPNDQYLLAAGDLPEYQRTEFGGYAVYIFDEWFDPMPLPFSVL